LPAAVFWVFPQLLHLLKPSATVFWILPQPPGLFSNPLDLLTPVLWVLPLFFHPFRLLASVLYVLPPRRRCAPSASSAIPGDLSLAVNTVIGRCLLPSFPSLRLFAAVFLVLPLHLHAF
jgi:hypothetical protein